MSAKSFTPHRNIVRRLAVCALAGVGLAALSAAGVNSQPYDPPHPDYSGPAYDAPPPSSVGEVIVRAPRHEHHRDSATGAPIEQVYTSRVVRYDDLDLGTHWGAHMLKVRVTRAAEAACDQLDAMYPITASDDPPCVSTAVREALYQTPLGGDQD